MFLLFIAARLTHVLDVYNIVSESNRPTFRPGSRVIASRLKEPLNNAFICFKKTGKNQVWIFRCIGKEGDVVEIRNAAVYLNNKLLDEPNTWNEYYISKQELVTIQGYVDNYGYPLNRINDSLSLITLAAPDLKTYHLNLKPFFSTKGVPNPELYPDFVKLNYNEDNFGPVKVPGNCYFLLGDNRHDAFDSRYIGFIKKSEVVSTVLN
jgi:signal peptidase I